MYDMSSALIVLAPLTGGYGVYMTMEAVATKSYWLGLASSLMSLFAGLCFGKLVWGGVL